MTGHETPNAAAAPRRPEAATGPTPERQLARVLLGVAALVLALLAVKGLAAGAPRGAVADTSAPAFELPLLGDANGRTVGLKDLDGRAAVINVWASWCPPCREEAPALRRAHEGADPGRVAFLGVVRNDSQTSASDFVERFELAYPQAVDDGSFARAYGVRGLPMTFVIDPAGRLTATHFGPISESRLAVLIADALTRGEGAAVPPPTPAPSVGP